MYSSIYFCVLCMVSHGLASLRIAASANCHHSISPPLIIQHPSTSHQQEHVASCRQTIKYTCPRGISLTGTSLQYLVDRYSLQRQEKAPGQVANETFGRPDPRSLFAFRASSNTYISFLAFISWAFSRYVTTNTFLVFHSLATGEESMRQAMRHRQLRGWPHLISLLIHP